MQVKKTWLAAWAIAMLAAAACSAPAATVGTATTSSASRVPRPTAVVSIGSLSPTDAADIARERAVQQIAEELVDQVEPPAGSTDLHGARAGVLSAPPHGSMSDDLIDVDRSWHVPGSVESVFSYLEARLPAGLTLDGSSDGDADIHSVFYKRPAGSLDEGATLLISAAPDGAGGVDRRADVQDIWRPIRSAREQVPSTVTGATVVRKTHQTMGPSAPTVTTIQLGLQQAQRIASMLNALPTFAGGAPNAGGPPDTVLVVTFVTDGMTRTFTMGNEFGFIGVDVDLDGDAQQQLIDSGPLLTYLDSLFGVIDSPEPVVSPPTG